MSIVNSPPEIALFLIVKVPDWIFTCPLCCPKIFFPIHFILLASVLIPTTLTAVTTLVVVAACFVLVVDCANIEFDKTTIASSKNDCN